MLGQFTPPLVMILIFSALPGTKFAGMEKEQLINYYFVSGLLYVVINSTIDSYVKYSIYLGSISTFLVKPVHFWLNTLARDLSNISVRVLLGMPFFVVYLLTLRPVISLTPTIFFDLFLIIISYTLSFLISYNLGLMSFWVEELWGFQNLKDVMVVLLGGVLLPYQFFPDQLQKVLVWLPFPYLVNWPLRIGFSGNVFFEIIVALLWVTVLFKTSNLLWSKGIKKYTAVGM